jgi:L-asparagine transporter-like permease
MSGSVGLIHFMPDRVLTYVMNTVGWMVLFVWGNIMVTHLFYRWALSEANAPRPAFRLPGAPYTNWLVLALFALAAIEMAATDGGTTPFLFLLCWLACLSLVVPPQPRRPGPGTRIIRRSVARASTDHRSGVHSPRQHTTRDLHCPPES